MTRTLKILSEMKELDKIRNFLKESVKGLNVSEENYFQIELSLLEICINIINYAYPQDRGEIFLKSWQEKKILFLEIKDNGLPFDPGKMEEPDVEKMIKEGKKGGLGIFLTRKFMDGFDYRREKNQNIVIISKRIV